MIWRNEAFGKININIFIRILIKKKKYKQDFVLNHLTELIGCLYLLSLLRPKTKWGWLKWGRLYYAKLIGHHLIIKTFYLYCNKHGWKCVCGGSFPILKKNGFQTKLFFPPLLFWVVLVKSDIMQIIKKMNQADKITCYRKTIN